MMTRTVIRIPMHLEKVRCKHCGKEFSSQESNARKFCSGLCSSLASRRPLAARFWEKVEKKSNNECWPWTGGRIPSGYGMIGHNGRTLCATHVSWEIHFGFFPSGLFVLHDCDNPSCVNPGHLQLGDQQANVTDMIDKDRHYRGSRVKNAKLTEDAVLSIRADARTHSEIARDHNVVRSIISRVKSRAIWRHVA